MADDGVQFQAPFNVVSAALNSVLKFVGRKDAEQVTMSFANADVSVPASATTSASTSASQQQVSADDVDDTSSAATAAAAAAAAADIIIPKGFSFGVKRKPGAGTTALVSFMNLMLRALAGDVTKPTTKALQVLVRENLERNAANGTDFVMPNPTGRALGPYTSPFSQLNLCTS